VQSVGSVLRQSRPDLLVSKQKFRKVERIELVCRNQEEGKSPLAFTARPFVLCGLPIRRPVPGQLIHERRNGNFTLQVTGHPELGLPFGQDRLVPIFLATIFFGTDSGANANRVVHLARFNFMREATIWYSAKQGCENIITLTDELYAEVTAHPIPTNLDIVRLLAPSPGAMDLYVWLAHRCFTAKGPQSIPLFGPQGLAHQLGSVEYSRSRKFKEVVAQWLRLVYAAWPACPAILTSEGHTQPALALGCPVTRHPARSETQYSADAESDEPSCERKP
jgi:hypothetical protein